jgi:ribosomal-protein-alanine N-acetyltransferase
MKTSPILECVLLRPGLEQALARFFDDLAIAGDDTFFHPHEGDVASLRAIADLPGKDVYVVFIEDGVVLAYGLLRGWNEGYSVPSLGIAVHPRARARGLGRLMMDYLETMARRRGAPAIRLRVLKDNVNAIAMYERRGYIMSPDEVDRNLLVGVKTLEYVT